MVGGYSPDFLRVISHRDLDSRYSPLAGLAHEAGNDAHGIRHTYPFPRGVSPGHAMVRQAHHEERGSGARGPCLSVSFFTWRETRTPPSYCPHPDPDGAALFNEGAARHRALARRPRRRLVLRNLPPWVMADLPDGYRCRRRQPPPSLFPGPDQVPREGDGHNDRRGKPRGDKEVNGE